MTERELHEMVHKERMIVGKLIDDGARYVAVDPLTFGEARLGVGTIRGAYDDVWYYSSITAALNAWAAWDGEGEPDGWYRHPPTGRRRPGGDPTAEYILE